MTIRSPASTLTSIWRAWGGTQHLVLGCVGLAVLYLWSGPIDVPGRGDIAQIIWPLAPTFLALACLTGSRSAHRAGEQLTPRGAVILRAGYLAALILLASVLLVASGPIADRWVLARNDAFLCGMALVAVELLAPSVAWTPVVLVPMLTWLLGSNGLSAPPEPWAVLLEPAGSPGALTASVLVAALGAAAYVAQPLRTDAQRAVLRRRSLQDEVRDVSGVRSGR